MTYSNRIAIVICAHRPYVTLETCLRGFLAIADQEKDLIFVNNGSSEELNRIVSQTFPGITILNLSENRLFCGGYNAGIRAALERNYDFVLLANADTEVANTSFISELLEAAKRWPQAAFLGPLVYYRNRETVQNTQLRFPSVIRSIFTWLPWRFFPRLLDSARLHEEAVEFLNGVCILCRCAALREFGLMDEQYGGYVEDADWSWRARQSGWKSAFIPVPSIIHHEEPEGYEYFSFKSFLLKRNTVLWFLKAGCKFSAFLYALASIGLAVLRAAMPGKNFFNRKHRQFLLHLNRSYRNMLFGDRQTDRLDPAMHPEKWEWNYGNK